MNPLAVVTAEPDVTQAVREEKRAARVRAKAQADAEVPTLPIPHFLPITRWWVT